MKYLVVIDMQNDFTYGALRNEQAIAIIPALAEKVSRFGGTVIFTRDTHSANYLETQEGRRLPVEHCIAGTPGWQIVPELPTEGCLIFDKPTFGSLELARYMAQQPDVEHIELAGVCTDICVLSNAALLKACLPEVPISVDSACCAGVTPESHRNALEAMKMIQIEVN